SHMEDYIEAIANVLEKTPSISDVKDIIARELGQVLEFEIDLYVPPDITVTTGERIKKEVNQIIKEIVDRKSTVKVRLFAAQEEL
uniref:Magnetosome membrane protein MamB, putative Co/Zn/Cd cation transporter. Cation diffusion facilitator family n=1 Tax=Desulfamplus magnetovallimortis TaxID=1246637 RepID=UPI00100D9B93|nr:Chain A, Magnetosome membrane protein MamB, putative Co/Zn/Cd cation transporter. Cation diffusion facilitator family [Desulfamplus magnetovallimortis]6QFJ_B Chain B, Magnetosome membrane protein MamB, putative Co/Zn/Cd cation transporter. Cation diffusion facilitator family [Desulfamplus magnetovallimortis]6QFJ_C Chain C, Magnetosome membrane protein MamB, putative Co/Zn/Cd cation transporter. Cation diffusion facilitator family [Desulfamplus magnetovallimortis]6QFJ_D Chain D, Magnetosome me